MLRRHLTHKNSRRSGAALVEAAMVVPVFFVVILAIIEFGRAMMAVSLMSNAAREAARAAIIDGSTNAAVTADAVDFLQSSLGVPAGSVTVNITVNEYPGNPSAANEVGNASKRDLCNITIRIPFDDVAFIPGDFLAGADLTGHAAMRHE